VHAGHGGSTALAGDGRLTRNLSGSGSGLSGSRLVHLPALLLTPKSTLSALLLLLLPGTLLLPLLPLSLLLLLLLCALATGLPIAGLGIVHSTTVVLLELLPWNLVLVHSRNGLVAAVLETAQLLILPLLCLPLLLVHPQVLHPMAQVFHTSRAAEVGEQTPELSRILRVSGECHVRRNLLGGELHLLLHLLHLLHLLLCWLLLLLLLRCLLLLLNLLLLRLLLRLLLLRLLRCGLSLLLPLSLNRPIRLS